MFFFFLLYAMDENEFRAPGQKTRLPAHCTEWNGLRIIIIISNGCWFLVNPTAAAYKLCDTLFGRESIRRNALTCRPFVYAIWHQLGWLELLLIANKCSAILFFSIRYVLMCWPIWHDYFLSMRTRERKKKEKTSNGRWDNPTIESVSVVCAKRTRVFFSLYFYFISSILLHFIGANVSQRMILRYSSGVEAI